MVHNKNLYLHLSLQPASYFSFLLFQANFVKIIYIAQILHKIGNDK